MKKKIIAMSLALVVVAGVGNGIVAKAETYTQNGTSTGGWTNSDDDSTEVGNNITTDDSVKSEKDVKVTFTNNYAVTYSVEITWGALTGTANSSGTWDPQTHTYESNTINITENTITVKNNSDTAVNCSFAYTKDSALDTTYPQNNITGNVSYAAPYNDGALASAIGYTSTLITDAKYKDHDDLKTVGELSLSGSLNETITSDTPVTVGKVTVTLND